MLSYNSSIAIYEYLCFRTDSVILSLGRIQLLAVLAKLEHILVLIISEKAVYFFHIHLRH